MKKYTVRFKGQRGTTSGTYYTYDFEVVQEPSSQANWISVDLSYSLETQLGISETSKLASLAAKTVELHLLGEVPADSYRERENENTVILLTTRWYPGCDRREPGFIEDYRQFEVTKLWENRIASTGDYNLLPHQEELLYEIVRVYSDGKGRYPPVFLAARSMGGTSIIWDNDPQIHYNRDTAWDDLQQLASEGLLGVGDMPAQGQQYYRITNTTLEAVAADFRRNTFSPAYSSQVQIPMLDFSFIKSPDHRAVIERDYEEVRATITVNAHKSTIVLCGSIVEALLLERLSVNEPQAKAEAAKLSLRSQSKTLDEWELYDLVQVAAALSILSQDATTLADQLRGYRNVIHPGYEKRKGFEPTPGRAQAAIALLSLIVEALT